jgi:hypothetical protein
VLVSAYTLTILTALCHCSPWGDYNVKVVSHLLSAANNLVRDGHMDEENVHHQYGLRVAAKLALSVGASEFRRLYNGHNVGGPRGGIPEIRRKYRTRPTPPATFDTTRDWAAEYAAATGTAYHGTVHFVQWYSEELISKLFLCSPQPPSAEDAWCDIKLNGGCGDFRQLFILVANLSAELYTADSIKQCQAQERRARGAKALSEDGPPAEDGD